MGPYCLTWPKNSCTYPYRCLSEQNIVIYKTIERTEHKVSRKIEICACIGEKKTFPVIEKN